MSILHSMPARENGRHRSCFRYVRVRPTRTPPPALGSCGDFAVLSVPIPSVIPAPPPSTATSACVPGHDVAAKPAVDVPSRRFPARRRCGGGTGAPQCRPAPSTTLPRGLCRELPDRAVSCRRPVAGARRLLLRRERPSDGHAHADRCGLWCSRLTARSRWRPGRQVVAPDRGTGACSGSDVFWQVGDGWRRRRWRYDIGAGDTFVGNILALGDITMARRGLDGRAVSLGETTGARLAGGNVALAANTIRACSYGSRSRRLAPIKVTGGGGINVPTTASRIPTRPAPVRELRVQRPARAAAGARPPARSTT